VLRRLFLLLVAATCAVATTPQLYPLGELIIGKPWSRPTAAGMPMGVAYLTITNNGSAPDALIAASTPAAARVEFHQTTISGGMARMRPVTEIAIPARGTVTIEPGGIHLMLVDLGSPLEAGKLVPLVLEFRKAGRITVQLSIEAQTTTGSH